MTESLWQIKLFISTNRAIEVSFPIPILIGKPSKIPGQQSHSNFTIIKEKATNPFKQKQVQNTLGISPLCSLKKHSHIKSK